MEIRVLGPLEVVSRAGTDVVIGSPKQRELLALLAAHAPLVVSTDRIVDALWADGGDHLSSLRFHISKLRDVLDPDRNEDVIVTQPPGYRLGVGAESIDAHRFADLVATSEKLRGDDLREALPMLEEALGLWRGAPYTEFEYAEWTRQEVTALEELRLIALELRVDADLAMGRHGGLVSELESLLVENPLREPFWRQLMVALYRSDRQPEALRAYQRARDVFAELGVTPSADLDQLERQILLRDPALEPSSPFVTPPGNLPALISSFVGRREEVGAVRDHVATHRLVTLVGPGGVGKTRLAIEAARGLSDRFAGGVWLAELAGVDDADLLVSQVAGALGVFEGPRTDLPAWLVAQLGGQRALLVLDNCEHLTVAVGTLVAQLFASSPDLHILATSRQRLAVEGEITWRLAPLSLEPDDLGAGLTDRTPAGTDAVRLFLDRARAAQPSLEVTPEAQALALDVCRRLAGLPLAIELAAARLHMMSLRHLSQRLDDEFELLSDGPVDAVDHHRAMRATLDWSYRLLDPLERALFRRLAVFRGGFTLESVERFHDLHPAAEGNALQLLGRLVDSSMVEAASDDRFKMLEPIRHYGLLVLAEHGEESAACQAHGLVYREMFRLPESDLFGNPLGRDIGQFVEEMDNVRVALSRAFDSGDLATAVELGVAAGCHFYGVGYLAEARQWLDRVLSVTSEATPHRARALARAAFIGGVLDGPDRADSLTAELEATAEELDDDRWRAAAIERRALGALCADDFEEASRLWDEATGLLLELDDPEAQLPLSNHMEALYYAGDYERADDVAEQLAELGRRFVLPEVVANALIGRSFIAVWRGDADDAERYFAAAAADHCGGAIDFDSFGSMFIPGFIALLRGDLDEAEELCGAHMKVGRESRHPDSFYRGLVLMGLVHFHKGDAVTGHRYLAEALRDASRLGLTYFQRYVLGPIAATWAMIDPLKGAVLIAAVEANNRRDHRTMPAPVNHAVEQAKAALEDSLRSDELEDAWTRGGAMMLEEATAFALQAG